MRMKTKFKNLVQTSCLALGCLLFLNEVNGGTPKWYGNDHFKISKSDDLVKVSMTKMPFESFSVNVEELETTNGFLSFEVKASSKVHLKVDGFTSDGNQINLFNEDVKTGGFEKLFYSLSESEQQINHLIFYVNPGEEFTGEIFFKSLKVSSFLENGKAISLFPNPTADVVTIELPDEDFQNVAIYDMQGRLIMEKPVSKSKIIADLNGQKSGIYMIKAKGQNATLTKRFMVK